MRFIFVLGLAGPEDSTVPNESHAIAGMFAAIFEYELGDVGFARSPRSSAINSVVLFLCGARERQIDAEIARQLSPKSSATSSPRTPLLSRCAKTCFTSGPPTNLALRARTNLQVRNSAKAKTTFRRQNHPRRPLPRWLTARAVRFLFPRL